MLIRFTRKFAKQYNNAPKNVQMAFDARLILFIKDKNHPLLNNHALFGQLNQYRSISVTGDWRALYRDFEKGELVFFEFIGTHSQLYK